jgi:hypothetical protein
MDKATYLPNAFFDILCPLTGLSSAATMLTNVLLQAYMLCRNICAEIAETVLRDGCLTLAAKFCGG